MIRYGPLPLAGVVAILAAASVLAQTPPPAGQGTDPSSGANVTRLFATSCGWCHQGGGRVAGRGPKLAGTDKTDDFLVSRIKQGKPPGMPAFGKSFNDEQIQAIIAYIRALPETP
ncbi:cytochrome c [Vineibacter terrae]|uniref:c-type cytochrome n=1 Tax=Vineibacter terrae TaxID=2586908 RepID=UPI002E2EC632|nr:cytochrome c [Vineibacter terrae]HEX2888926.1 cytochrome c [Vineibacter terrae]